MNETKGERLTLVKLFADDIGKSYPAPTWPEIMVFLTLLS